MYEFVIDYTPIVNETENPIKYNLVTLFPDSKRADLYFGGEVLKSNSYNYVDLNTLTSNILKEDEKEEGIIEENKDEEKKEDENKTKNNNRYFNLNTSVKCFNCNEIGHISRRCPNEKITICNKCNKEGHTSYNCPDIKCFRCNKIGHKVGECTENNVITCDSCGRAGHKKIDCLNTESYYVMKNRLKDLCFPEPKNKLIHMNHYDTDLVSIIDTDDEHENHMGKLLKLKTDYEEPITFLCPKCSEVHSCKKKCEAKEDKSWDNKRYKSYNTHNNSNYNNNYLDKPKDYYRERSREKEQSNNYFEFNKKIFKSHGQIDSNDDINRKFYNATYKRSSYSNEKYENNHSKGSNYSNYSNYSNNSNNKSNYNKFEKKWK